jgi:hypothetical protein
MNLYHTFAMGLIVCVTAIAGCSTNSSNIQVLKTMNMFQSRCEYLITDHCGIFFNENVVSTEISYAIRLRVRNPLPESAIVVLKFENPDSQTRPDEVIYEPASDQKYILVLSHSVACIDNDRHYRIAVTLFADRDRRNILGTYVQMVPFSLPAKKLRQLRVTECHQTE